MGTFSRFARRGAVAAQLFIVGISLYQSVITALGYRRQSRGAGPNAAGATPRFGLIVCARNEEAVVAGLVRDLLAQDYPEELRRLVVVAHNCDDATGSVAARAGASVVEHTTGTPGKAYAVLAGLAALGGGYDFVGIFDADARVEPGLLKAIAARSDGEVCLQAEAVPIADHDWLAEGYGFGRRARNLFWWRPRESLGLSTTITGCGWFIRPDLLDRYLTDAKSITEDLELTARLVADGHRVAYVSAGRVAFGETRDLGASVRQRSRWVRGHIRVILHCWPALAVRALRGNANAADLAIYLLVPTRLLTRLGVTVAAGLAFFSGPAALPGALVGAALAGEWALPAWIGFREHLVRLSSGSLSLALRHSLLSLLWFPIGAWAVVTAGWRSWDPTPRAIERDATNVG